MPRFTWTSAAAPGPATPGPPFNVCRTCAQEPVMMNAVVARKLGVPQDGTTKVEFQRVSHGSYDFSPTPVVCAACGRVLSAEDD